MYLALSFALRNLVRNRSMKDERRKALFRAFVELLDQHDDAELEKLTDPARGRA